MTSTAYDIHQDADHETVLDVLTAAFQDDPVVRWLFPDPAERRRLQPSYYTGLLRQPFAETYATGGGAAVWLDLPAGRGPFDEPPPGTHPEEDPLAVFGQNADRLLALGCLLAGRHPHDQAHLYLACLGVLPGRRGSGLGSALVRHRLAESEGVPAYLEASSERSRALYLRHGFEDLGDPIQIPNGPFIWPMWRSQDPTN